MRIGVNTVGVEPGSGADGVYVQNVLAKMRQLQPDVRFVLFTDRNSHERFEGWDRLCLSDMEATADEPGPVSAKVMGRAAHEAGVDAIFTALETAPVSSSTPLVVYAMDLAFLVPEIADAPPPGPQRLRELKRVCAQARGIVAPSEFTQREFLARLGVPLNKVTVAHLGVDPVFEQPQLCIAEKPFILNVGSTRRAKNLPRLLEACERLQDDVPHTLAIAGRPGPAEPADWGPRVIRIHRCPVAQLAGLYQHCDVLALPSLYDGTGITVLEAMRSGTRVAASRVGAIPEVAGSAPIYVNPLSVPSIIGAIRRAIQEDKKERALHTKIGRQQAAQFTWEKCAWRTLMAFKRE